MIRITRAIAVGHKALMINKLLHCRRVLASSGGLALVLSLVGCACAISDADRLRQQIIRKTALEVRRETAGALSDDMYGVLLEGDARNFRVKSILLASFCCSEPVVSLT